MSGDRHSLGPRGLGLKERKLGPPWVFGIQPDRIGSRSLESPTAEEKHMLQRRRALDRGASLVEYGAVILLVAGIVATVALTNVPAKVSGMFSQGMDCILRLGECERPDGTDGPQAAPGEDDGAPSDRRVVDPPDGNAAPPENADFP